MLQSFILLHFLGLNNMYIFLCYPRRSYLFDDFKLLHDTLNISNMVSLEKDEAGESLRFFCFPFEELKLREGERVRGLLPEDVFEVPDLWDLKRCALEPEVLDEPRLFEPDEVFDF